MAQITKSITVDVAKRNTFQAIVAKQHDRTSRFLKVTLTNEGNTLVIDPTSVVTINAKRADGASKAFVGVINDDNTVTVPLTSWMLELDDRVTCDISVVDVEGNKLTSISFDLDVETASYSGDDIENDENYDLLVSLISAANNANSAADEARDAALKANSVTVHPPKVSDNGFWMVWNADIEDYVETSYYSKGDTGEKGSSIWTSNVEYMGGMVWNSWLNIAEDKSVNVGDLILFTDGHIARVVNLLGEQDHEGLLEKKYEVEYCFNIAGKTPTKSSFRLLRTITIPSNASLGSDDVAYANMSNGGITFAFDTDMEGNPFECTEFIIASYAATSSTDPLIAIANSSEPVFNTTNYELYLPVGKGESFQYGFCHLSLLGDGTAYVQGAGGLDLVWNGLETTIRRLAYSSLTEKIFTAFSIFMPNTPTYGFLSGSSFKIYGR